MAKHFKPRAGSVGYSPRKRARRSTPHPRNKPKVAEAKPLAFLGYKAGMTHLIINDLTKNSPTYNMDVFCPVTIVDSPPLLVFAYRAYVEGYDGLETLTDIYSKKLEKDLDRVITLPKKETEDRTKVIEENIDRIVEFTLIACTQPKKAGIGKKTPEILEIAVGGTVKEQYSYCKQILGKEISVKDVLGENTFVDVIGVTKGKGTQGQVKRWGIKMQKRKHKRSGHMRMVGCIGAWTPANTQWMVPKAGQMGYHHRTDLNKLIIKLGENGKEVTPKGGFLNYGEIPSQYIIIKGSLPGAAKRLVALRPAIRPQKKKVDNFEILYTSVASKQGM